MDWGIILKDIAPLVAIVLLFVWVLPRVLSWVSNVILFKDKEVSRTRETLHDLASAINNLTQYLKTQDNGAQLRSDRNMIINLDRFDDLEYLIEGVLPESEKERLLVIQERRKQRELKYTRFLASDTNLTDPPSISAE